jgi:tetratricopeptide (TPR) repeat protein
LDRVRESGEENSPQTISIMSDLAGTYCRQGKYEKAELMIKNCLEKKDALFGAEETFFALTNNLANIYESQGKYNEAEVLYKQFFDAKKAVLGENHPYVLGIMFSLSSVYNSQGRILEAQNMLK